MWFDLHAVWCRTNRLERFEHQKFNDSVGWRMIVVLHKPKYAALSRQTQAQKPGIQLLRVLATACLACPACPCCCPCVLCASQQFLGSINRSSYTHQKFEKKTSFQYSTVYGKAWQLWALPKTISFPARNPHSNWKVLLQSCNDWQWNLFCTRSMRINYLSRTIYSGA